MKDTITQSGEITQRRRPAITLVRMAIVLLIAIGYVSTLPLDTNAPEALHHFGYAPSWIGVNVLFMSAGFLAMQSLHNHGSAMKMLSSRFLRLFPVLVLYGLVIVGIIYPILGETSEKFSALVSKLGAYFLGVITCLDPASPLPGLMDDANYACVIQGAIWTFRWGLIAYIALAIGWHTGLFNSRRLIGVLTALTLIAYIKVVGLTVWEIIPYTEFLVSGLRLGSMFLIGTCVYVWQDRIPRGFVIPAGLYCALVTLYYLLPWTPLIEPVLCLVWGYVAFIAATYKGKLPDIFNNAPDLTLGIYLIHWPAAQILLLIYPETTSWELIVMSLPVTIILAYALHSLLSRRIDKRLSRQVAAL